MPTAAKIDRHDVVIGQPTDWDEKKNGHCGGLAVRFEKMNDVPFMRSAWEATPTEAHMLLSGAKLVLGISAPTHPVVNMTVDVLPDDFQPCYVVRPLTSRGGKPLVRVEALVWGGGSAKRVWIEQPVDEGGMSIATGRAMEAIEELIRENGWATS